MPQTAITPEQVARGGTVLTFHDSDPTNGNKIANNGKTWLQFKNNGAAQQQQTVSITGTPDGGTFTLTYSGQETAGIAFDATAQDVEDALVALSNIASGDVDVSGSNPDFTVTFGGNFAGTDVELLAADGASLTGGTTPDVAVAAVTGTAAVSISTPGTIDGNSIADLSVSLSNGQTKTIPPLPPNVYSDSSGNLILAITGTGAANVDIAAFYY